MLRLRDYQEQDLKALNASRNEGVRRNAMVLPTGAGKTVMFSHDIAQHSERTGDRRKQLILVDRDELASQTLDKLSRLGLKDVGLVKAASNEIDARIIVGSIQTLRRDNRLAQLDPWSVGHIIVDECDLSAAAGYLKVFNYFGALSPDGPLMTGWTATLTRTDGKTLANIWQAVPGNRDILEFVERGDLRDPYGIAVTVDGLDLANVARSKGDFEEGKLAEAMMSIDAGAIIVEKYLEHAQHDDCSPLPEDPHGKAKYRQFIAFCPTVEYAEYQAACFNAAGVPTAVVIGETSREERRRIYAAINSGELHGISSVGVLTRGFDLPPMSCAIMARPTLSPSLYVQMAGRVLRPDLRPGHAAIDTALILDCVGNAGRHKLATIANLSKANVQPKDGETLSEAVLREAEEESEAREEHEKQRRERVAGTVAWEKIDLFHRSHSAWLKTHDGVWFVPSGKLTWFLLPDGSDDYGNELYRVGTIVTHSPQHGKWTHRGLPIDLAMSYAEQEAAENDASVSQRMAPWRTRRQPPSPAQTNLLQQLRIEVPETKSEASDVLSVHFASRALDPMLRKLNSRSQA